MTHRSWATSEFLAAKRIEYATLLRYSFLDASDSDCRAVASFAAPIGVFSAEAASTEPPGRQTKLPDRGAVPYFTTLHRRDYARGGRQRVPGGDSSLTRG